MYESFYHLSENPFGMTPDPRFLYKSRSHTGSLAYLATGVFGKKGFLAMTGEVGVGKTTVVRAFVHAFHPCLEVAFILNPRVNFEEMLYLSLQDFGCKMNGSSKVSMLNSLNEYLIEMYAQNKNPVLIIDEAQNLRPDPDVIEELRMLSNLETDSNKLIQIVLIGQPELEIMLNRDELRQLRQRIPGIHRTQYIAHEEVSGYIDYRLSVAGLDNGYISFAPEAYNLIFEFSEGIPRLINQLCDKVLVRGCLSQTRKIEKNIVEESIEVLDPNWRARRAI